jgi:5'-nucleotidase
MLSPMRRTTLSKLGILGVLGITATVSMLTSTVQAQVSADTVNVQLLAFNDLHGNLEPPAGSSGRVGTVTAGGFEYLATIVRTLKAQNPNTLIVSAGDLIGASPLLSALFADEPTIEAASALGLDVNGVGNHEFDKGFAELSRIDRGGCKPVDGCFGSVYGGSTFPFLAANVFNKATGKTIFDPYLIKDVGGVKVGFFGLTLKDTPTIVTPSGVAGLRFEDEAKTINDNAAILKDRGVNAIVVLIHQGGRQTTTVPNDCTTFTGPIIDIVKATSKNIDVFLTAHTHEGYNCIIDGKPVMQGASFGRLVTKVDLVIAKGRGGAVQSAKATNVIVTRDVARAPDITALIAKWNRLAAPRSNRVIGTIGATFDRTPTAAGEQGLGDLLADSQLWAAKAPANGGAQIAFMNPGGIRTDLVFEQQSGTEGAGQVTYGEAFAVQPFGNNMTTLTMTGAQIKTVLEQQFDNPTPNTSRMLQVSKGFTYTWIESAKTGSKVDASTLKLDGKLIDPAAKYRVTVNAFLADGGDNFLEFAKSTERVGGAVDLDALEGYLASLGAPAPAPTKDRIAVAR